MANDVTTNEDWPGLDLMSESQVDAEGSRWALARGADALRLVVRPSAGLDPAGFEGERVPRDGGTWLIGRCTPGNAAFVRRHLPWLAPQTIGLRTSAGFGDRTGLATPGHVRALREAGGDIMPVFAQQSIREMTRTGRSPLDVVDAATWGAFEAGWRGGFGADADHLKTAEDMDACLAAGFTWFTIDPGAHVDAAADHADASALASAVTALPWHALEDTEADVRRRYAGSVVVAEDYRIAFDEITTLRAAAKYGRAVAHVAALFRHLQSRRPDGRFDFEVSVDETDTPTTPAEHVYVAQELRRLGVRWTSLAPRFVGRFEKGVDYIGDLEALEADLRVHAAISRAAGPYKLSLHSGSDKFSIYPLAARHTRGLVHLKTAGTSYLEALRAIALVAPAVFRAVYRVAFERYEIDRASYHVSAELARAPRPDDLADADLAAVLDQFDARQVLHVTFGSILKPGPEGRGLAAEIHDLLAARPEVYAECLSRHFVRHLAPFVAASPADSRTDA
jgi:hypothetical protein